MTYVRYELESGDLVCTLCEAKESGMKYRVVYEEHLCTGEVCIKYGSDSQLYY